MNAISAEGSCKNFEYGARQIKLNAHQRKDILGTYFTLNLLSHHEIWRSKFGVDILRIRYGIITKYYFWIYIKVV